MSKVRLKLKPGITGKVSIYSPKFSGRKMTMDTNTTDPSEYEKYLR